MNNDKESITSQITRDYPCTPAVVLKFFAEILIVIGLFASIGVFAYGVMVGILWIIGVILIGLLLWVLSLIVRVCYKYLNL